MKAIFATGLVSPKISRRSLDAVLAFGATPAPRALFEGIRVLPPGRFLEIKNGHVREQVYWDIPYNDAGDYPDRPLGQWSQELRDLLMAATRRRLKADVPVGVYLSGGIDSATIASTVADAVGAKSVNGDGGRSMQAFTIGFPEPGFDESDMARRLADQMGLHINVLQYPQSQLAIDLPRTVYHGETPLVSTESVPLMAISQLASRHVKVVLTGEGSDEALGGYLYFRWEALQRTLGNGGLPGRFMMHLARTWLRHALGKRNPFVPLKDDRRWAEDIFGYYPAIMMKFLYLRMVRQMVYSDDMLARQQGLDDAELLDLPLEQMRRWEPYNRTLYLSSRIFMTSHLLGSHGDRALMSNSVEGRYPFLDRTVQEFCGTVPPSIKTTWLTDKFLLRRAMASRLPREIIRRQKKPFLAPAGTPFVGSDATDYIRHLLSPECLRRTGYFDPLKVQRLVEYLTGAKQDISQDRGASMRASGVATERLVMGLALTFVVSTQILADQVRQGRFSPSAGIAGFTSPE